MVCKVCGCNKVDIIYDDYIRKGAWGVLTKEKYKMYQCKSCQVIWHDRDDMKEFYESAEYRMEIEKAADIESYYENHDKEVLEKLQYTGTDIYRNKVVCDIGCGGGSFLNFVAGASKTVVAVEPSEIYRENLANRGYRTYSYASEALKDWEGKPKGDISCSYLSNTLNNTWKSELEQSGMADYMVIYLKK